MSYPTDKLGDRYYRILNTLSGKAQEKFIAFFNSILNSPELSDIFEMLLACENPDPIVDEIWFYYINNEKPQESLSFKEYALKYIALSATTNFQQKDNDLSKKALLVGNIPEKELDFLDLKR